MCRLREEVGCLQGATHHVDDAEADVNVEGEEGGGAEVADRGEDAVEGLDGVLRHGEVDGGVAVLGAVGVEQGPLPSVLGEGGVAVRLGFFGDYSAELVQLGCEPVHAGVDHAEGFYGSVV